MKIFLMKIQNDFLEDLGDEKSFSIEIEKYEFDRWLEDREAENRISNTVTFMPMVNFEQFIQLPLRKTDSGASVTDRYKGVTEAMMTLHSVGTSHPKCTHAMFVRKL